MKKADLQKIADSLNTLITDTETVKDNAQQEWDDKSEKWQESDKGTEALDQIEGLDGVVNSIQEAHDALTEIINSLS